MVKFSKEIMCSQFLLYYCTKYFISTNLSASLALHHPVFK